MKRLFAVFHLLLFTVSAFAYDNTVVHPRMTLIAFQQALDDNDFITRIGLPQNVIIQGKKPGAWAAFGSTHEDDKLRVINHFYDPINESALVIEEPWDNCTARSLPFQNFTARQWALITPNNEFGIAQAKMHLLRAMAGATPLTRQNEFVALFTSLGHVVHLVQDMAQPQHTRNDLHPTGSVIDSLNLWSRYETWCQNNLGSAVPDSAYTGYPLVTLPSNGAYFKTGDGKGLAEYANRNFVTEHTNYSDPMCAPYIYTEPAKLKTTERIESHTVTYTDYEFVNDTYVPITLTETFKNDKVLSFPTFDAYTGATTVNANHSFYSLFDFDVSERSLQPVYSLPPAALSAQASLLVPRAVGYSAGFISHFFRGKANVIWTQKSLTTYDVTIVNRSAEPIGADASILAAFRATPSYLGKSDGTDVQVILDFPIAFWLETFEDETFNGLTPNERVTLHDIEIPGLQSNDSLLDFERRTALQATLGSEPSVVIPDVQPINSLNGTMTVDIEFDTPQPTGVFQCCPGINFVLVDAAIPDAPALTFAKPSPDGRHLAATANVTSTESLLVSYSNLRTTAGFTLNVTLNGETIGTYRHDDDGLLTYGTLGCYPRFIKPSDCGFDLFEAVP